MPPVLVLAAHPDLRVSRVNRRLLAAARSLAAERPQQLAVRDLYALYPDFAIDVEAEQAALLQARLIVWQHPIRWQAMPALMKLWLDEVLRPGWACGPGGEALRGKSLWPVLSTGSQEQACRPEGDSRPSLDACLSPYRHVAALCGMHLLPPLVLQDARSADEALLDAHVQRYVERLDGHSPDPDVPGGSA